MNVAKVAYNSKIYGPGIRSVIWFQGCSIRCDRCINPDLIPFIKREELSINDLIEKIKNPSVTLLGGEPLDQKDIFEFMLELKKNNIQIVLFTGYEWNELKAYQKRIISETCQLVILGPFDKNLVNPCLYLRGSNNQEIRIFDSNISLDDEVETYEIILGESIEIRGRVSKDIFDILEENK